MDFSYRATQDGRVRIFWLGRHVTTLAAERATAFLAQAEKADEEEIQALLQRATGNFKRGNERRA